VQLHRAGIRPSQLHRVLLTHLHSDHVIDLGHLVLTRWIVGEYVPLEVLGRAGTAAHVERLLALWAWDVEVRRAHMYEREPPRVRVTELEEGVVLARDGLRVTAFLVEHEPVKPAFGFRFDGPGRRVVISGDTRPSENLIRHAQQVDLLIHECTDMTHAAWTRSVAGPRARNAGDGRRNAHYVGRPVRTKLRTTWANSAVAVATSKWPRPLKA
jgi:ribonuclease Z